MNYSSAFDFEYEQENELFFNARDYSRAGGIEYLLQPGSLILPNPTQPRHDCMGYFNSVSQLSGDTSPGEGDLKKVELVLEDRPAQSAEKTPNSRCVRASAVMKLELMRGTS